MSSKLSGNTGMKLRLLPGIRCCTKSFSNLLADAINRKRRKICFVCQTICMGLELRNARCNALFSSFLDAGETLKPLFGKAMDKCIRSSKLRHCTMEQLLDFIQLVSGDGKEIHSGSSLKSLQLHKLDFFKDFISFVASQGVGEDELQDLLAHTRVMVITAAFCSYMLGRPEAVDGTTRSFIYSQYSEMLNVLPFSILKASRSLCFFPENNLLGVFINSLLENHLDLCDSSSRFSVPVMKIIIKELRFLRNFLKYQRQEGADLDEEIANLICDVVSEAGTLSYSLSLADLKEDTELGLSNWMEKVQFLKQDAAKKYLETSGYKFPRTDELGPILMAPKLSDSTRELQDSTRKLSDLIDTLRSYMAYLEDLLRRTHQRDTIHQFRPIKIELRLAQTIYSCLDVFFLHNVTSESDDQSSESFLDFLGVAINKKAWEIYSVIQEIREGFEKREVIERQISHKQVKICSSSFRYVVEILKPFLFGKALDKYMHAAQSKHCSMKEFLNFFQLVLEDGNTIHSGSSLKSLQLHKLEFLKYIISFAASRGVGQDKLQDLLAHPEVIVTTAAYHSYMVWEPEVTDLITRSLIYSEYFSMLNNGDSYIRDLKALGSSCSSDYTNLDDCIVGPFINSFLENHWKLFASESNFTYSFMKILIEELRFLKNFFIYKREEGGNLDEEMANLIVDVVCGAGKISFSLPWDDQNEVQTRDIKLGLSNWMEKVQLLKEDVAKKYPETSRYKFPRTNELGFMDGLVEDLKELIRYNPDSIAFAGGELDIVLEDLLFLRDFLRDMVKQKNEHEKLKALWFRVVDVAYEYEFVINSLVVGDPCPDYSPTSFNTVKKEIKKIRAEVEEICRGKRLALNTPKISNQPSRNSNPTMDVIVVGFEDEVEKIIERLEANSAELDIVSIVGMPGQGKTTLAKKIYNDIRIKFHFHVCAWCCVSQGYLKRKLLLDILSDGLPTMVDKMSDEDLEKFLYQSLKGKRYLIVLDDIWDIEAWLNLQSSFPNDHNRSRILITSRIHLQVKPESEPHLLRALNVDESRKLLQAKLLHNKGCPENVQNLVAKICQGLPLAVVTVAGILETLEQDSWEEFAAGLSTALVSGTEECTGLLELSYIHLPDYLKPCLLYFGSFLQDQEIPVSRLIWLWVAEGFVQKTTDDKSLENVAEDYLRDLINRSLVMVVKRTSRGGIKTCSVHDLIHQFCLTRAKEENFLLLLDLREKTVPLSEPRRLCIDSWDDYCQCFRHLSSLKFSPRFGGIEDSSILCSFKILKVLDLRGIYFSLFPATVEMLVLLRFLALAGSFDFVPSTIVKLWNLETFLLTRSWVDISLPYSLLNMTKLRHMRAGQSVIFSLQEQDLEKCCESSNLETFSTLVLSSGQDVIKIILKMPHLRKLKCTFYGSLDVNYQFPALDFLSQLESLRMYSTDKVPYPLEFSFPVNLKKLTLSNFGLPWTSISRFAQLPKLEVLKLLDGACEGETWDMEEEEVFTKLQFLKFEYLNIVHWNACCDNFPCLRQLVLHNCTKLQGIPSGLGEVDTLEIVEVTYCHSSVATSVRKLEEEREGLKVFFPVRRGYFGDYLS